MKNIPTVTMDSHHHSSKTLRLQSRYGLIEIPVANGRAVVPYPQVREAFAHGFVIGDASVHWPPRKGTMSPPSKLNPGDVVPLPDGTEIVVPAPFNQALDIPERFIAEFETRGWTPLAQFA